ncbi:hypothetical protein HanHA300_Chr11g0425271 [Helianthus annuus]|nr:hypothetical protein HanHA300_Chr11g0425271 [Helianthus annuus]KAJ0519548.1 hypothetical protein HanHA89_Chr11g0449901 [Helianthus annuus]KAJ0691342.1 hypothetical protein HanOQP8_Chr11g0427891 [Helianthus annuus]
MQDAEEVVFYEECEPIIDGEPGDLRVSLSLLMSTLIIQQIKMSHSCVTANLKSK